MFERINKHLLKHVTLSEEEIALFNSLLEFKKIPKKNMLLHPDLLPGAVPVLMSWKYEQDNVVF